MRGINDIVKNYKTPVPSATTPGPTNPTTGNFNRNISSTSELNRDMLKNLKNDGLINSGGRSGGNRMLTGTPNSYGTTTAGHTLVYDSDGRLIFDISAERVKMTVWDQAPNGKFYPRNFKLDGVVPSELLGK